jgi:hypothetical protein
LAVERGGRVGGVDHAVDLLRGREDRRSQFRLAALFLFVGYYVAAQNTSVLATDSARSAQLMPAARAS